MAKVFVRANAFGPSQADGGNGWSITGAQQVDVGDLLFVGVTSNIQDALNDIVVTDDLGNVYGVAAQGFVGTFGENGHAGDMLIAYSFITHAGVANIKASCSHNTQTLCLFLDEWTPPTGMIFDQGDTWIGDVTVPPMPNPDSQVATAPVNYGDSIVVTLARDGGWCMDYSSLDGDTKRGQIPGLAVLNGGGGALFDIALGAPGGIRNSNVFIHPNPTPGCTPAKRNGFNNILIASFTAPIARPGGLLSQAAIRPGKSGVLGLYNGQTQVNVSLPYKVLIGSRILVGCGSGYTGGTDPVPAFTVTDAYGHVYTPIVLNSDGIRDEADAMFTTIVTTLPTSGPFKVTISMVPFPAGTGAQAAKSMTVGEYFLAGGGAPVGMVFAGNTNLGGGMMHLFTGNLGVGANALIAGFAITRLPGGAPPAAVWTPSASFITDTSWGYPQVDPSPAPQTARMGTGAWIHKYVTLAGTYDGEIDTDYTGNTGIIVVAIPVSPSTVSITCPLTTNFTLGVPVSIQLQATGGTGPYTYALTGGSFPAGVSMDAAGLISGIPLATGTFTYSVTATDSLGATSAVGCPFAVSLCTSIQSQLP